MAVRSCTVAVSSSAYHDPPQQGFGSRCRHWLVVHYCGLLRCLWKYSHFQYQWLLDRLFVRLISSDCISGQGWSSEMVRSILWLTQTVQLGGRGETVVQLTRRTSEHIFSLQRRNMVITFIITERVQRESHVNKHLLNIKTGLKVELWLVLRTNTGLSFCFWSFKPNTRFRIRGIYTRLYSFIVVYACLYSYIPVYTGLYPFIPVYTGIYMFILVYTRLYLFIPVYTSLYPFITVNTRLYLIIPVYTRL